MLFDRRHFYHTIVFMYYAEFGMVHEARIPCFVHFFCTHSNVFCCVIFLKMCKFIYKNFESFLFQNILKNMSLRGIIAARFCISKRSRLKVLISLAICSAHRCYITNQCDFLYASIIIEYIIIKVVSYGFIYICIAHLCV